MTTAQGPIGRPRTKPWPEGADHPKPKRDVTPALPHAQRIILLTGRYKPKIMGRLGGGSAALTERMSRRKGWRRKGGSGVEETDLHSGSEGYLSGLMNKCQQFGL